MNLHAHTHIRGDSGGRLPRSVRLRASDLLRLGLLGPRTRRLRSVLSALGIALGIAAVVAVTGISASNQAHLLDRLDRLGSNLITVAPGKDASQRLVPLPPQAPVMLGNIAPVQKVTATGATKASVYRNDLVPDGQTNSLTVLSASLDLLDALHATLRAGRWLDTASQNLPVVVLGDAAARRLGVAGPGERGEDIARIPSGTALHIALSTADGPAVPRLVRPEHSAGWLALTADPTPLLGLPADSDGTGERDLLDRRDAVFATVQEHYYASPPRIERGWRHHLLSTDGRSYLDIVNNVTPLGHAHPRVEQAVSRQLRRLNTNSRFHYASVVEFTERLAALLPQPLDTVFLVNSGSEAVDLGLRLAIGATGQHDIVALREAYHGWTYASDAVSTSLQDNPNALATRPGWVHTVDSPNSYRGRHRGADAVHYGPEAVAVIDELAASGRPAGAFIGETFYGNAGGVALPDGYLAQVYAAVRRHGGLAVADEVQVGYGRLGHWFWGFEQQQVVPDIVCVAKAMGNGHPLGAVITSKSVADRYREQGYFFSSTGGSPVSSTVGLTVLDTLRDEDLQGNAVRVGSHLKSRLEALADRYDIIGAVHGSGLYLGLELVRDRVSLEPATEETAELCDRMLDLGVVVQPTGDHLNILKIKPPLCIDTTAADFFADMLDLALVQLGHGRTG
ncbi:aminotransferase class III-fold pyridoxal phosphate-dependent enzyme [Streptomyces sp. CB01580]|uniref:aminotransferase class III-fold pyridoxal phosphate-dependent enzyme n=1 Tax=Streptomyces sp. CB01580 TaxID=1703933 RepID=UPI0009A1349A|nr:aminotransferase class III-fold pyridoxal phosphate-dependent enzyme [Streptomyces sp. CB01580]